MATEPEVKEQDVNVKVMLAGGHHYSLALKSDTPLLKSLLGSVYPVCKIRAIVPYSKFPWKRGVRCVFLL
jgi:hypothetical protein